MIIFACSVDQTPVHFSAVEEAVGTPARVVLFAIRARRRRIDVSVAGGRVAAVAVALVPWHADATVRTGTVVELARRKRRAIVRNIASLALSHLHFN